MTTFLYFAYGSNMLSSRLRARCPSAVPRTAASVSGFRVAFSKLSVDGSGKATLRAADDGKTVAGVVYEIAGNELSGLDAAEGPGYERHDDFFVRSAASGDVIATCTYIAVEHIDMLRPYDWYLKLVLAGLLEHDLGDEYLATFRSVKYDVDSDVSRGARQRALRALRRAGHERDDRLLG